MPPTVPVPLQSHVARPPKRATLNKNEHHRNIARATEEDKAVQELTEYLAVSVKKLAAQFDRTEQHFWSLLSIKVKENPSKRRSSGFNALVHELAAKENADRPVGSKLSVPELVQKIRAEGLYERMSSEEIDQLIQKLETEKLSTKYGKRLTAPQKTADVAQTLKKVENELLELHGRCGVHAMLFAVRNDTTFKMDPYCFFTDEESRLYLPGVRGIDTQDFALRYEGWILSNLPGVIDTGRRHVNQLKAKIREMVNKGLAAITGIPQISMVYSQNYEDRIVMQYGVSLEGWPLPRLKNPSEISTLGDLNTVADALKEGRCYWKQLTAEEFLQRRQRLQQEVEAGIRKPLKYGGSIGEVSLFGVGLPQKRRRIG